MFEEFEYQIITGLDDDNLMEKSDEIFHPAWDEFMRHDSVANEH